MRTALAGLGYVTEATISVGALSVLLGATLISREQHGPCQAGLAIPGICLTGGIAATPVVATVGYKVLKKIAHNNAEKRPRFSRHLSRLALPLTLYTLPIVAVAGGATPTIGLMIAS